MATTDNQEVFDRIAKMLEEANFKVASNDFNRPWGGFFVIDEAQAKDFVRYFMPDLDMATIV
ncbi:MAG: hypothetical protein R2784_07115, partial [Saprospiraceae bacterium]